MSRPCGAGASHVEHSNIFTNVSRILSPGESQIFWKGSGDKDRGECLATYSSAHLHNNSVMMASITMVCIMSTFSTTSLRDHSVLMSPCLRGHRRGSPHLNPQPTVHCSQLLGLPVVTGWVPGLTVHHVYGQLGLGVLCLTAPSPQCLCLPRPCPHLPSLPNESFSARESCGECQNV